MHIFPARLLLGAMVCLLGLTVGCGSSDEIPWEEVSGGDDGALDSAKGEIVYGLDDRQDVYAHPNATLRTRAQQSTMALMRPSALNTANPGSVTLNAPTLQSKYNLCATERFLKDPSAAFCSGTLIDDDLVLTAGHCVVSALDCANVRFVFNYYRPSPDTLQPLTTADIFSCSSLVVRAKGLVNGQNLDYAIVKLDRVATPRFAPAPVRLDNSPLTSGQKLAVIGSSSGIPFKIDSGGSVRDPRSATLDYFVATTDTFGGSSGSGVYEVADYTLAGIVVRGGVDYVVKGTCSGVNVCSETGCRGEDVTYVYPAIRAYCSVTNNGSMRLCNGMAR